MIPLVCSMPSDAPIRPGSPAFRLRKHADYQRVYAATRKQHSRNLSYFAALQAPPGDCPHVGLTAGKVLGGAVERNRIKRRMREAVRLHLAELRAPVDVVLHPRRIVLTLPYADLERELRQVFRSIQAAASKNALPPPQGPRPPKPAAKSKSKPANA